MWACPPWRRWHGASLPPTRSAYRPHQRRGYAALQSCELSLHLFGCISISVVYHRGLQALRLHDRTCSYPCDNRCRCAPQVVRLQRDEQRWVLWGREASLGQDAAEQRLGSFDAVVLCDALTARQGQSCSPRASHNSRAITLTTCRHAPGLHCMSRHVRQFA